MDSTTLPSKPSLTTEEENLQMVFSLYEAFQELPDERRAQGKRYSLALIVCLLILAKLAGQKSVSGATQWLRHRRVALAARFGLYWSRLPCHTTYCNVLAKVDGAYLDKIVSAFFEWWEAQSRGARGMQSPADARRLR